MNIFISNKCCLSFLDSECEMKTLRYNDDNGNKNHDTGSMERM